MNSLVIALAFDGLARIVEERDNLACRQALRRNRPNIRSLQRVFDNKPHHETKVVETRREANKKAVLARSVSKLSSNYFCLRKKLLVQLKPKNRLSNGR